MIQPCKICGVSDSKTLEFLTSHSTPPQMIGFIVNWEKSPRFVEYNKLKNLLKLDKKKSKYVAVLVKPDENILEKIKNIPFDYYQIYDCNPKEIKLIKEKYNKKIITAFAINNKSDVEKYHLYDDVTDIYLFDGKGYEKSKAFDHQLIKDIKVSKKIMIAGNIQFDEDLEKYAKIADIIDISGGCESSGLKDISKIEIFLKKIKQTNNEA
tara:strand:- start:55 stop:684 length:630 start_codon:yes stop_codon:yes gene_type:complete